MPDEPAQTPEVALSTAKPGRIKRALWCRWFHRWHMPRYPAPAVSGRDPAGSSSFTLSAGPFGSHAIWNFLFGLPDLIQYKPKRHPLVPRGAFFISEPFPTPEDGAPALVAK